MIDKTALGRLIAVDWGTTNFRAWLLGANGEVLDCIRAPRGVSQLARDGFVSSFRTLLAEWLTALPNVPVVMAGMVGSADGLVEVPYLSCPVDLSEIAANMAAAPGLDGDRSVRVVAGLSCRSLAGNHDVMRGEEVQIIGALEQEAEGAARLYCVPGSHSKWVSMAGSRVTGFSTSLTGEAYNAMREHTLLARSITGNEQDEGAFQRGLIQVGQAGGLLHHLFSVRTEVLQGTLLPQAAASYLSGILIGNEVRAMLDAYGSGSRITVIGGQPLAALYACAIRYFGRDVCCVDGEEAAHCGMHRLVQLAADTGDSL